MERKFSGKRLYALLKRVVIVVSVLAALWAAFSLYMYEVQLDRVYESTDAFCKNLYGEDNTMYIYCIKAPFETFRLFEKSWLPSTLVALFLPVIFFGASWFYRYVFPVQETENELNGS